MLWSRDAFWKALPLTQGSARAVGKGSIISIIYRIALLRVSCQCETHTALLSASLCYKNYRNTVGLRTSRAGKDAKQLEPAECCLWEGNVA